MEFIFYLEDLFLVQVQAGAVIHPDHHIVHQVQVTLLVARLLHILEVEDHLVEEELRVVGSKRNVYEINKRRTREN